MEQPTYADIRNCQFLLSLLKSSFQGAVINGLVMDDLIRSLINVLSVVPPPEEPPR
jgi:hypothetical protein